MGFVYLLECITENETIYKIGYTKDKIQKRINKLQTGNGYELIELYKFPTKYKQKVERHLHRFYNQKRLKGEWFRLDKNDVDNFLQKCEQVEKGFDALKDNPFFNKSL